MTLGVREKCLHVKFFLTSSLCRPMDGQAHRWTERQHAIQMKLFKYTVENIVEKKRKMFDTKYIFEGSFLRVV